MARTILYCLAVGLVASAIISAINRPDFYHAQVYMVISALLCIAAAIEGRGNADA